MGYEPEDGSLDRDVDASMRMFQRSQVGPAAAIPAIRPARVLLVLDGSGQDETSVQSVTTLRERFNVETLVLDARERKAAESVQSDLVADTSQSTSAANSISAAKSISGARPITAKGDQAYDMILDAVAGHQLDMVIVPSPFGRSFEKV